MIVLRIKIWPNQNQFWKGYKIQVFNIKNKYYLIITIVLYSQLYQKIITRCSLYKNLDGMIITLVLREKSRKVVCVPNGTEMLSNKATTNKNMPSPTLSRKQLTIICQKKKRQNKIPNLWQMKLFSENFHSPLHHCITHTTPGWPTPPLHDPPHPYGGPILVDMQP